MRLQLKLQVDYSVEEVTNFFYEPSSLAKWDKSVVEMIPVSSPGMPFGSTFDTIAPSGMRMHYRIIEFDSGKSVKIALLHSKMFKKAVWRFQFNPLQERTEIICSVCFSLRLPYLFLYPVLYFCRPALLRDLRFFEEALGNYKLKNT